jgi:hypothetical protein
MLAPQFAHRPRNELVEMAVALLILGMLFAFSVPAFQTINKTNQLHGATENMAANIRVLREKPVFTTPNVFPPADFEQEAAGDDPERRELIAPQHCYVCKQHYLEVHSFYDQLCPACGDFNYRKRTETADLRGRVALLTGGRVKIGYQAGIKLLRAGAQLIVTTRFPRDAATRYAQEPDFDLWVARLEIFGLDLRHTPSVEAFCAHLSASRPRLDFIVNNACQTVRRPSEFYRHMLEHERAAASTMPAEVRRLLGAYEGLRRSEMLPSQGSVTTRGRPPATVGMTHAAELSQVALLADDLVGQGDLFPEGRLDQDLQQVDLRERNSWRLLLAEVSSVELLETQRLAATSTPLSETAEQPLLESWEAASRARSATRSAPRSSSRRRRA